MTEIKRTDFKENDRVELSAYFDVFTHGNGFQLKREDRTYSIIPIRKPTMVGHTMGWEVNSDENQFDELTEAIEYVLEEENVSVKVHGIREFYGMEEEVEQSR